MGVGLTNASTYGRFAVNTPTSGYGVVSVRDSVAGGGGAQLAVYYGTFKYNYIDACVENGTAGSEQSRLMFATSNAGTLTERMRIDNLGRVTTPSQPSFMAVVGTEVAVTGGAENLLTTAFTSTTYNVGSHFNTANGRFTAPVAGLYHFVADFYVYSVSSVEIYFKINGSTYIRTWDKGTGLNSNPSGNHRSYQVYLSASDYVSLTAIPNTNGALWNGGPYSSRFTGCLIG
jgi:hypothetical protein